MDILSSVPGSDDKSGNQTPVSTHANYHGEYNVPLECPRALVTFGKAWYDYESAAVTPLETDPKMLQ